MKRVVLLGAGLVVVGIAAYLVMRGGDDTPAAARPTGPAEPVARPAASATAPTPTTAPSLPGSATVPPGDDGVISYKVDTVTIHDHRGSNAGPPIDVPPTIHPPGTRQIPPSLTGAVAREFRRVLFDCTKDVPPAQRGPGARVDGEVIIAIKDGRATVSKTIAQLRNTTGDTDSVKQCLEQRSVGIATDAQGEADLDAYSIHVSMALVGAPPPP